MKPFVIAMLAVGITLLLAALLWPDRPQRAAQRSVRPSTVNATFTPSKSNKPALEPISSQPADAPLTDEQLTLKQTGIDNTSLRNIDFPRTYISKIHVDLASPNHWVTLTWSGPNARLQPTTQYHSSPGRGLGNNTCD